MRSPMVIVVGVLLALAVALDPDPTLALDSCSVAGPYRLKFSATGGTRGSGQGIGTVNITPAAGCASFTFTGSAVGADMQGVSVSGIGVVLSDGTILINGTDTAGGQPTFSMNGFASQVTGNMVNHFVVFAPVLFPSGSIVAEFSSAELLYGRRSNINLGNSGVPDRLGEPPEDNTLRIGTEGSGPGQQSRTFIAGIQNTNVPFGTPVVIGPDGQLGTNFSSRRLKTDIEAMGEEVNDALFRLRPVAFRHSADTAKPSPREYGLIAEEVAEVLPALVGYDQAGRPETVRYHVLPALLLNAVQKQAETIARLQARMEQLERLLLPQPRK